MRETIRTPPTRPDRLPQTVDRQRPVGGIPIPFGGVPPMYKDKLFLWVGFIAEVTRL